MSFEYSHNIFNKYAREPIIDVLTKALKCKYRPIFDEGTHTRSFKRLPF